MFASLSKLQKDFAVKDDIIYILLQEIVGEKHNQNKKFSPKSLFKEFQDTAANLGLDKLFNKLYLKPSSVTSHLAQIKNNISDEIIMNRKRGSGNGYYYWFSLVDESNPISDNQALEMLMNKDIEEQIDAYNEYMNDKGGKDE